VEPLACTPENSMVGIYILIAKMLDEQPKASVGDHAPFKRVFMICQMKQ